MCVSLPALPVAQPVAVDGACFVHLPSLPLSVKQTDAIYHYCIVHKIFVPKVFSSLLLQLKFISKNNGYFPKNYLYI